MSWPTPQDYNEAIQNPWLSFDDPELQAGAPELTPLGLPRPITGNFASVYRLHCNGRDWAVRCFWRELTDLQERYRAISHHLEASRLPYTVGFEYLPRGIQVRGAWYPILKMEWVEGVLLNEYIEAHLHEPRALNDLTKQWVTMVAALERVSIAHGDLQHGNVLVVNGSLKLVDYDGMFVPTLAGRTSPELGHQNYQHPRRAGTDFGPTLDRFSAWVVYLSLLVVSRDPALWTALNGGDECLLLRKSDFELKGQSSALSRLERHPDRALRVAAARFRSALSLNLPQVPPLNSATVGGEAGAGAQWKLFSRLTVPVASLWRPEQASTALEAAWHDGPGTAGAPESLFRASVPAWVQSPSPIADQHAFTTSPVAPRLCTAAVSVASAVSLLVGTAEGRVAMLSGLGLALVAVCLVLTLLFVCYRRDPAVMDVRCIKRREREHMRSLAAIQRRVRRYEAAQSNLRADLNRMTAERARRVSEAERRHQGKRDAVRQTFQEVLDLLEADRRAVDRWEREVLAETLLLAQLHHLNVFYRKRSIWSAPPEVGWTLKLRLWLAGVRMAGQVDTDHAATLKRYDPQHIKALIAWRVSLQSSARRTMPASPPEEIKTAIEAPCTAKRNRLAQARQTVEAREAAVLQRLDERHARSSESPGLGALYRAILDKSASRKEKKLAEIDAMMAQVRKDEPFHHRQAVEAQRELEAFENISFARYVLYVSTPVSGA